MSRLVRFLSGADISEFLVESNDINDCDQETYNSDSDDDFYPWGKSSKTLVANNCKLISGMDTMYNVYPPRSVFRMRYYQTFNNVPVPKTKLFVSPPKFGHVKLDKPVPKTRTKSLFSKLIDSLGKTTTLFCVVV